MRRMRVFRGVGISVVHAVQNSICPRRQERRTLANVGKEEKEFLPERVHGKHFMRCVTVQVKRLHKQRKVPVYNKKDNYDHAKMVCLGSEKVWVACSKHLEV